MDDYDFRQIDKEVNNCLDNMFTGETEIEIFDLPFRLAGKHILNQIELNKPPSNELIAIGEYDGGELPLNCHILDGSYIVYIEVTNSELTQ